MPKRGNWSDWWLADVGCWECLWHRAYDRCLTKMDATTIIKNCLLTNLQNRFAWCTVIVGKRALKVDFEQVWISVFSSQQSNRYQFMHMLHFWQLSSADCSYHGQREHALINILDILGSAWCCGSVSAVFGSRPSRLLGRLVQFTFYLSSLFGLFLKP